MTKGLLANEQRKELARLYYMQGMQQKEIAERVGVSRNSVSAWVRSGQWDTQRAARSITRAELVRKMLHSLDERQYTIYYLYACALLNHSAYAL